LPRESALHRKLLGERFDWNLDAILLRNILFTLQGANWQRGGGKPGSKPKPIEIPDGSPKKSPQQRGEDIARRMRNLGLIPAS
jgi:hypothetical protein